MAWVSQVLILVVRVSVRDCLLGMVFGRSWPAQMTAVWVWSEAMIQRCL